MKEVAIFLVAETAAIVFAVSAGVLAFHGKSDWGWFILASLLTTVSYSRKEK